MRDLLTKYDSGRRPRSSMVRRSRRWKAIKANWAYRASSSWSMRWMRIYRSRCACWTSRPDAGGRRVLDLRSRHGDRPYRRGIVKVGDETDRGIKSTQKTTCTGVEMTRKLLDEGATTGHPAARHQARRRSAARRCASRAKIPAYRLQAELRPLLKKAAVTRLQGLPSQFYFRTTDVTGRASCRKRETRQETTSRWW